MLGTLALKKKADWKSHVGSLVHAYNCSKYDMTGFFPYYLMFGHHPRIAVDIALGRYESSSPVASHDYINCLKEGLRKAFVPKSRTVVSVPTPRRTWGLSVIPQIDESSLA